MKYNYFILTKKFHGKTLYDIGLENDLNEINNILTKENVEIEHEPVAFITIKELNQLKGGDNNQEIEKLKDEIERMKKENEKLNEEIENMNNENKKIQKELDIANIKNKKLNNKNSDENEKLKEEIEKINKENEKLKRKLDLKNKNLEDNNSLTNDYNNLLDEIDKLNEKNKEIEKELNEKQNLINEYESKLKDNKENPKDNNDIKSNDNEKLIEENQRLQAEREKFIKYINELQEYDEKVIAEYQKLKTQLQIEIQKNNLNSNNPQNVKKYFTNNELGVTSNDTISIYLKDDTKEKKENKDKEKEKKENVIDYLDSHEIISKKPKGKDESIQTEEDNNFNDELYEDKKKSDENKKSISSNSRNSYSNKQSIRQSREVKRVPTKEQKKRISLKNERPYPDNKYKKDKKIIKNDEYLDDKKKNNKVSFAKEDEDDDLKNFIPKNKREESLKRAMKRIQNKRKQDALNEEKNKFRKSEKITGMAGELEKTLSKGEGRLYVDEEYEKNREQEEEEYEDNNLNN